MGEGSIDRFFKDVEWLYVYAQKNVNGHIPSYVKKMLFADLYVNFEETLDEDDDLTKVEYERVSERINFYIETFESSRTPEPIKNTLVEKLKDIDDDFRSIYEKGLTY
jgi:hypothetical protein